MQIVIDIPEEEYMLIKQKMELNVGGVTSEAEQAIVNGTPVDLEGLKTDMKALNCGYPYGLDYLLNCLNNRLGITIIEADTESEG